MFRIDFNRLRFLVYDDNPHMRRILRALLHSFGAREVYKTKTYFGTDRRRNTGNTYIGPERRVGGEVEVLKLPSPLDKARATV